MPDFFLDRLITLGCTVQSLSQMLEEVVKRKGGCIDDVTQADMRGGNAVNTASALASLNVNVTPILCTNRLGLKLIKFYLTSHKFDLSHIKISDAASMTTAIEFRTNKQNVNVMLRDVGSLAEFGLHHLDNEDYRIIQNADYVCIFNWAGTKHFGTELAETIFRHVKDNGKGKTYYDTADPTPNKEQIPKLMKKVLQSKYVDILSVNENEAIYYASQLSNDVKELGATLSSENLAKESARVLAVHLSSRVDLHATGFSGTFTKSNETIVPAFKVPVLRATGAGDAWNAGNIFGDACGLSDEVRLALANAVAAYYISHPEGTHPTKRQLREFCKKLSKSVS